MGEPERGRTPAGGSRPGRDRGAEVPRRGGGLPQGDAHTGEAVAAGGHARSTLSRRPAPGLHPAPRARPRLQPAQARRPRPAAGELPGLRRDLLRVVRPPPGVDRPAPQRPRRGRDGVGEDHLPLRADRRDRGAVARPPAPDRGGYARDPVLRPRLRPLQDAPRGEDGAGDQPRSDAAHPGPHHLRGVPRPGRLLLRRSVDHGGTTAARRRCTPTRSRAPWSEWTC